jgi:hypothetical protein
VYYGLLDLGYMLIVLICSLVPFEIMFLIGAENGLIWLIMLLEFEELYYARITKFLFDNMFVNVYES